MQRFLQSEGIEQNAISFLKTVTKTATPTYGKHCLVAYMLEDLAVCCHRLSEPMATNHWIFKHGWQIAVIRMAFLSILVWS
jgi:hypothetical protein